MGFFIWLENTALADWVRTSFVGYPLMITLHAIGMAVMVGVSVTLDLRLLGFFRDLPYAALQRYLGVAWVGFAINTLSGTALFTTQSVDYVTNKPIFLVKMALVLVGAIMAALLQTAVARDSEKWGSGPPSGGVRAIAVVSLLSWVVATIAGRLTAYL